MTAGTPCALAMFCRSATVSAFCSKKPPSFVAHSGSSSPMRLLYDTTRLNGDGFGVAVGELVPPTVGEGDGATAVPPQAAARTTVAMERARARRMRHLPHTRNGSVEW